MIVVDTSALIAIIQREPEEGLFVQKLIQSDRCLASTVTIYETGVVIGGRRGPDSFSDVLALLYLFDVESVPFSESHMLAALEAYRRYGKGFNPKSRLNFGDCATYALAKTMNAPLLFKGNDFAATDIHRA